MTPPEALFESNLPSLQKIGSGKVRDLYAIDDQHMLIVTSDRLSAFDVVLPDPIPGKGRVLTAISNFWFTKTRHIIANHIADLPLSEVLPDPVERSQVEGRAMVVKKLKALPIEAVAVVLIVALVLITGGLHLEGLADACDGLFGGHTRDERLAIMRDPRVGVYGVLGLVAVLGLKWAGLQSLPSTVRVEALLLAPTLSRWSMVVAIAAFPYARTEGLGRDFHAKAWPWGVALSGATVLAVAGVLLGFGGLVVVG
ncbi:MAG: adenosylcobinamide-GDP ribazoletransferase, partial [Proteobacteria bacterium]|nr:adenosylcobinamide-GDP ribazoletransferase [Pseudomonadota bacterium]